MSYESDPARKAVAITPSDSTIIPDTRGIYVGAGGSITVVMKDDSSTTLFVGATAGSVLPIEVSQVYATGTSASNLVALY